MDGGVVMNYVMQSLDIKKGQIYGITDIIEGGWLHGYLIKDTSHSFAIASGS